MPNFSWEKKFRVLYEISKFDSFLIITIAHCDFFSKGLIAGGTAAKKKTNEFATTCGQETETKE